MALLSHSNHVAQSYFSDTEFDDCRCLGCGFRFGVNLTMCVRLPDRISEIVDRHCEESGLRQLAAKLLLETDNVQLGSLQREPQ